jgi:hypothetical protein
MTPATARLMATLPAQPAALAALADDAELYLRDDAALHLALLRAAPADWRGAPLVPLQLRFAAGRHGADAGPWLFHVGLWVPAGHRGEFLAWYEQEHLPMLLEWPQWEGCRFMEEAVASGCQFHALHQLADRSALSSPARAASRRTPWFDRFKAFDWFDEAFTRTLYRRIER